jgi:shikimate kinase
MKSNIALIGFMGVGKTAVGRALAKRLGKKFVEMDALIERKAGKTIPAIFREDGEVAFRELEIEITGEVSRGKDTVIACGGGIVLNQINIERLKQESRIVYLTASPDIIIKRTSSRAGARPLLDVADPAKKVAELLKFREPFYRRAADITINTSRRSIDRIVVEIIDRVE